MEKQIYPAPFLKRERRTKTNPNKKRCGVYLDYAATTPIDPKVLEKMLPYLKTDYGNPSSIHALGQKSLAAIDESRESVSQFLGCQVSDVIFTGSATEANNLAIFGVIKHLTSKFKNQKLHIITSKIEHHSVLEPFQVLEKGGVEVTYLPVNKEGLINITDLEKAIRPETILVSIIYANNEIGTIQPIAEIGKLLSTRNQARSIKIYFHTDAVQAANYLDCDVNLLGVDLLTLSAHKVYGPKGVGALFVREGVEITPLIFGGGHEFGLRSGTENVSAIAGFGAAIAEVRSTKFEVRKIQKLRDRLIREILKNISGSRLNGSLENRLPNNTNFAFKRIEGESLVIALDQEGIAASTGSACSATTLEPSHVLLALGLTKKEALSSLRLTLGKHTTIKEIDTILKVLPKIVERLRKIF